MLIELNGDEAQTDLTMAAMLKHPGVIVTCLSIMVSAISYIAMDPTLQPPLSELVIIYVYK